MQKQCEQQVVQTMKQKFPTLLNYICSINFKKIRIIKPCKINQNSLCKYLHEFVTLKIN